MQQDLLPQVWEVLSLSQGLLSTPLLTYKQPVPHGEVTKGHLSKEFLFTSLSLYP